MSHLNVEKGNSNNTPKFSRNMVTEKKTKQKKAVVLLASLEKSPFVFSRQSVLLWLVILVKIGANVFEIYTKALLFIVSI